ncbi:MAG: exopolysaccharide biosynthesis protein [Candidatus Saccharibacteria bacterium]|nr:exopolysaccharide biosynthesis protein [Candidatus Saccharibacteria bacterium]
MNKAAQPDIFSDQLEAWLKGKQPKSFDSLINLFKDKSFAVIFLVLMILPALPLPTGGITHIFEIIVMLLCLEMIAGFKTIWLPKRWRSLKLGKFLEGKAIPLLLKRVRQVEKRSSPRWRGFFTLPLAQRFLALLIFGLTLTAFLSPPFSGLDTLPSLGVVLISLAIILDDFILLLAGTVVGALGVFLVVGLSGVIIKFSHRLF